MRLLRLLGLLPIGRNVILSDVWFWTWMTLAVGAISGLIVWLELRR